MTEQEYDNNVEQPREKTVRGGLMVRTAVIGVIAGVLALSTSYVMATTEDTPELAPQQQLAMNEPQLATPDSSYTTLPPQDAVLPEAAAPQQRAEVAPRAAPRRAAPAETFEPAPPPAEPAAVGAPPALPAPADPAQTIPDVIEPVTPSIEG